MNPKVSIVIPVYNVEAYLPRCLDSVVEQTLREIEIICVNDGSPDNSMEILERYAAQDARVKVISQSNKGLGGARNAGFDAASGDYVLYIDSDDWIDADFCEKLYEAAQRYRADVACAGILKVRSAHARWVARFEEEKFVEEPQLKFEICNCPPDFYVTNQLFRREVLRNLGIRFKEHVVYEDVEYLMRILCETHGLVTVPGTCYRYMVRDTSITKSRQTPQKQMDRYRAHKEFLVYADAHGIRVDLRHRNLTRRFWAWGGVTLLKIKERDGVLVWRLFDAFPIFRKKMK